MISKKEALKNFKLYAVTDFTVIDDDFFSGVETVLKGGVDILQLRAKKCCDAEWVRIGRRLRKITRQRDKLFFVNDRVDIALAVDADGVHVGQEDMPIADIRSILARAGAELLIGKSTHSVEQAQAALREAVDYIGVGPIFETPTKPEYPAVGLELLQKVSQFADKPFVAIGGINLNNLDRVLEAGATRVAVVRALFNSKESLNDAGRFCDRLEKCRV